jgi:hypothetical protein
MTDLIDPNIEAERLRRIFQETGTKVVQQLLYATLLARFNALLKSGSHLDAAISALSDRGEVEQENPGVL